MVRHKKITTTIIATVLGLFATLSLSQPSQAQNQTPDPAIIKAAVNFALQNPDNAQALIGLEFQNLLNSLNSPKSNLYCPTLPNLLPAALGSDWPELFNLKAIGYESPTPQLCAELRCTEQLLKVLYYTVLQSEKEIDSYFHLVLALEQEIERYPLSDQPKLREDISRVTGRPHMDPSKLENLLDNLIYLRDAADDIL